MNFTKFLIPTFGIWGSLGFYRGTNHYTHLQKKYKNKQYLYTSQFGYGLGGLLMYANPAFVFFTLPNEVYRLEVDIRQLPKDDNYYFLL